MTRLKFCDEALTDVLHAPDLQVVLKNRVVSNPLSLLRVIDASQTWLCLAWAQIAHDSRESFLILLIQKDELVWDDAHFLEGDGLRLRPGEALDNPTLLSLLHLLNLLLHELDDDLILHIAVCFKRLLDVLTVLLVFLRDLTSDQVTD